MADRIRDLVLARLNGDADNHADLNADSPREMAPIKLEAIKDDTDELAERALQAEAKVREQSKIIAELEKQLRDADMVPITESRKIINRSQDATPISINDMKHDIAPDGAEVYETRMDDGTTIHIEKQGDSWHFDLENVWGIRDTRINGSAPTAQKACERALEWKKAITGGLNRNAGGNPERPTIKADVKTAVAHAPHQKAEARRNQLSR